MKKDLLVGGNNFRDMYITERTLEKYARSFLAGQTVPRRRASELGMMETDVTEATPLETTSTNGDTMIIGLGGTTS